MVYGVRSVANDLRVTERPQGTSDLEPCYSASIRAARGVWRQTSVRLRALCDSALKNGSRNNADLHLRGPLYWMS
jgi:hypothetical protein